MSWSEIKRDELELLFNMSLDLHCIASIDGYFCHVNPAFETVLGHGEAELLSQPFMEFVHPDDIEKTTEALESLSQGTSVVAFENRYRCSDGSYKILQWNASPEPGANLIAATARDVTREHELKKEVELEKKFCALGAVATTVAHDLRNVLSPILTMTGFVREKLGDVDPQMNAAFELIERSTDRGIEFVDQIMVFADDQKLSLAKINLDQLAKEVVFGIQSQEIEKSVTCETPDPTLCADSTQLYRALLNLCSNAVKAMPNGGSLKVVIGDADFSNHEDLDSTSDYIAVKVIDTGAGIPPAIRDQIFEPFFSSNQSSGGTGLGLAIVKKVVKQHGGFVKVNCLPGETVFSVLLPRVHGCESASEG